jgi:hypothetical protein
MTTKRFYRRRFLNRRGFHAGAYVLASCKIVTFRPRDGAAEHTIGAEVTIADCRRVVTIDFDVMDDSDVQNALYKARLLRDVLVDFTVALELAVEDRRERQR